MPDQKPPVSLRTPEQERIEQKFLRAGHQPENRSCDHKHYDFKKHGRYCTCGSIMIDFGD